MKITLEWLKKYNACGEGVEWFKYQQIEDSGEIINHFIKLGEHFDWADWLIIRLLPQREAVMYEIFKAEKYIDLFKKMYPDNLDPQIAIRSAKKWLADPSKENTNLASAIADDAYNAYEQAGYRSETYGDDHSKAADAAFAAYAACDNTNSNIHHDSAAVYIKGHNTTIEILKYGMKLIKK